MTCDGTSTETYKYSAAGCNEADKFAEADQVNTIEDCDYFDTQIIYDIYLRMNKCVENGKAISIDTVCGTPVPTMSPTMEQNNGIGKMTYAVILWTVLNLML